MLPGMKRCRCRWVLAVAAAVLALMGCSRAERTRVVDPETAPCEKFHAIVSAHVQAHPEGGGKPQLHIGSASTDAGAAVLLEQHGEQLRCYAAVARKHDEVELTYLVAAFADAGAAEAAQQDLSAAADRREWYRTAQLLFVISAGGQAPAKVEPPIVTAGKKAIGFRPGVRGSVSSEPRLSQP